MRLRVRPMLAPKIWVIGNRVSFALMRARRGIEQMESFARDARDHFRGHAAPRETLRRRKAIGRSARPTRARCRYRAASRSQIDHFNLDSLGAELLRDRERFVHHRAVGHDAEIASRPNDSCFSDRQFLRREARRP